MRIILIMAGPLSKILQSPKPMQITILYWQLVGAYLPTIKRTVERQIKDDVNFALDHNLSRHFDWGKTQYDLMVGLDMMHERSDYERRRTINDFDADNPIYTLEIKAIKNVGVPTEEITQYNVSVYLRNTIKIDDHWIIGLIWSS